jgi:hypothetical protein
MDDKLEQGINYFRDLVGLTFTREAAGMLGSAEDFPRFQASVTATPEATSSSIQHVASRDRTPSINLVFL